MAGDCIKMRSNPWDDPHVLCDETDANETAIAVPFYRPWAYADQHCEHDTISGMTLLRAIDRGDRHQGAGRRSAVKAASQSLRTIDCNRPTSALQPKAVCTEARASN